MSYFWTLLFALPFVQLIKAELSLQIFKNVNGTEVPVSHTLREVAGANFTLTCKLVVVGANDDTSYYSEDNVSWGWNRKNVQFHNLADLKKLAKNISKPLNQFLNERSFKQAAIPFHPLLPVDSGKYFCMSSKYELFSIIRIQVIKNLKYTNLSKYHDMANELDNIESALNSTKNNPQVFPKSSFSCTDMFICNSRTFCIKDENVCDNVKDCNDGSDENVYLCGKDSCSDKTACSNGRCISKSICCDYYKDISCRFIAQPSCCSEIIEGNRHSTLDDIMNGHLKNMYGKYGNEDNIPKFEMITMMPNINLDELHREQDELVKDLNLNLNDEFKMDDQWTTLENNNRNRRFIWIIIAPIMIVTITIIRVCLRGQIDKCRNGSRRELLLWRISTLTILVPRGNANSSSDSSAAEGSANKTQSDDLPPSYDDAVINVPQTTSLLA